MPLGPIVWKCGFEVAKVYPPQKAPGANIAQHGGSFGAPGRSWGLGRCPRPGAVSVYQLKNPIGIEIRIL